MGWVDEVAEFAKVMTRKEYKIILGMTDLSCGCCGNCCIFTDSKHPEKPPSVRCQYLTEDNLCRIHHNKPKACKDFPYLSQFDWVVKFKFGYPGETKGGCLILKDFWLKTYQYLKLEKLAL